MASAVIALASLRLAPIQCASFGHTANEPGDRLFRSAGGFCSAACFSETILAVPKAAMPFAPQPVPPAARRRADGAIRVAIPASTMKLNPALFDAIARIGTEAKSPVAFHFFPLAADRTRRYSARYRVPGSAARTLHGASRRM
jgi:hypothetical protein